MIDCPIKVEGLYVLNNNLFWTLLSIVICMHKYLLLPQPSSAFAYFFPWFNQWPVILKTDILSGQCDSLKQFKKSSTLLFHFFKPNISKFKAVVLSSGDKIVNKRWVWKFLLNENLLGIICRVFKAI